MKPIILSAAILSCFISSYAAEIPLNLPRPDDKPGDASKPVKVYILAGQSNMVGMGDMTGARPPYPAVFLSADPAIIPGKMPIGTNRTKSACVWFWKDVPALNTHGVYQSADAKAATGASVSLFKGVYDPKADYSKVTSTKSATFPLGTVSAEIPSIDGPSTAVAKAFIDVPLTGIYRVHVGYGDSTHAVALLDGKEVYRKEIDGKPVLTKVNLEAGKRYPVEITYFKGGSAAFWLEQVDLIGKGDLVTLTKTDKKFPYLIDDAGNWTVRNDVYFQEARLTEGGKGAPMSADSNKKCLPKCNSIGPEVGFGYVMGTFHDEQVLLIKTAQGNRSLNHDFRPPSSGKLTDSDFEGFEYRAMLKGVNETLANIDKVVPGYKGQGYEIAGFAWFQGHKDSGATKEEYEKHLVNLIKDLRKDLKAPNMKTVVATVGFHGYRISSGPWNGIWQAQMAVGDSKQHPDFAGNVASVDTRDFWREIEESPKGEDYHYNRNPETYLLVGESMGRAMVRMLGGKAAEIPKTDREAKLAAEIAAEAAKPVPTEAQIAASNAAVRPMIIDGLFAGFLENPRNQAPLQELLKGTQPKPAKTPEYLDDAIDDAVAFMQAAGIQEYDWQPGSPAMQKTPWAIQGIEIAASPYKIKATAAASEEGGKESKPAQVAAPKEFVIKLPAGMENWFATEFDTKKAGWKNAPATFGVKMDENVPEELAWIAKYPLYPLKRTMPTTYIENDVVLMRKTLEVPAPKEGHRYRIRVNGSIHENSGEAFAVYINGKELYKINQGVTAFRKQGLRGSHIWKENLEDFKGGKITIAVANYPMNNWDAKSYIPAIGPLSVWLEEQKLPPIKP
ncbi:MAG: sialate O-acetylesterase [Akkermansiaceae bacterium]